MVLLQTKQLLTPCMRITRGDQCHAHHIGWQLGLRVLTQRRLKCTLYCMTRSIELYMKTHSEIAHQYGAIKIFLLMTSGEMGHYLTMHTWCYRKPNTYIDTSPYTHGVTANQIHILIPHHAHMVLPQTKYIY